MFPYKDENPTRTIPFVTISIIIINITVFFIQLSDPSAFKTILFSYGATPSYLLSLDSTRPVHPLLTLFTSMFMHGGLLHIASNMLYLWIFGNNIEDRLGHIKFTFFYLSAGIVAAYAHSISNPSSVIPMIGASGAVSGVLGAYLLLFPYAKVHTLIFLGFFVQVIRLPAFIVIGFWVVIQLINGFLSKGVVENGGVAWFAHIGGFVFGLFTTVFFLKRGQKGR
jgi:membrane associated rhomboid family serine protease